ncbi:MAG TPA: hypothetical protein VHY22_13235 [Chthoniobacteraceae bacterium]|jgi:Tfp pilus assembly protein PilV|nr:hypothetical protein [Chthoniobacteraceae bacterium]
MRNLPSSIRNQPPADTRGSTLILSLIVILVLAACVGGAVEYTLQSYRFAQRNNARRQAISAANGVLERTYVQWRATCEAQGNVTLPASTINAALSAPTFTAVLQTATNGAGFLTAPNPVLSDSVAALNSTDPTMTPILSGTPVPSQAGGPNLVTYDYLATARVEYSSLKSSGNEGGSGSTSSTNSVTVSRVFQKAYSSPWLYAIAYNDDLEINPGANLVLNGAVETNGNLYTGGNGSGEPLTFNAPVSFAGTWDPNGAWSPNDHSHSGTAYPPTFGSGVPEASYSPPLTPENASLLTANSSNPNAADGYHEIIDVPNSSYSDPLASTNVNDPSERIFDQAGIIVQINSSNPSAPVVSIYEGATNYASGTPVTATTSDTVGKAIYTTFTNAITATTSVSSTNSKHQVTVTTKPIQLYDAREQSTVNIVQLDLSKIYSALSSGGALDASPYNIVYIYDTSYTATGNGVAPDNQTGPAAVGIQLINGSQIPANGLTIASENPVYVVGDYNTGGTGTTVPSNNSSTGNPQVSGYPWAPSAIMADSVTVLSSNWSNSSTAPSSIPTAASTTVNAAFLSGIVTSALGGSGQTFTYSGGAENFIRLLENWSGKTLTYYGSMEELYNSKQATGVWQNTGAYYQAPTRQWHFDLNFYDSLPPGTFTSVSYLRSRYFVQ